MLVLVVDFVMVVEVAERADLTDVMMVARREQMDCFSLLLVVVLA